MHDILKREKFLAAMMLMVGVMTMAPERVPVRVVPVPCAGPARDGTLLFTGRAPGESGVSLFAVDPAQPRTPRILVHALPPDTSLAPSPRGRYIALAEGARGLWLVNSNGIGLHRLLPAPPSSAGPTGTRYINAVAWSPDHYTIAYAVVQPLGYPRYPAPSRARPDGIWLVRYDGGTPRLLSSNTRLGVDGIGHLSFSANGQTLAVVANEGRGADNLAVDVATGRTTPLPAPVVAADDVRFSPVASWLAYLAVVDVPVPGQPNTADADEGVYVTDSQGRQRAMLTRTTLSTSIQELAWSPDGRRVAYLWGGPPRQALNEIHDVDVATGRVRRLVKGASPQQFMSLAWMHCRT